MSDKNDGIEYKPETFKPISWRKKDDDHWFEDVIFNALTKELANQRPTLQRSSKDVFIITSNEAFSALNHNFIINNESLNIRIECMCSENSVISPPVPSESLLQDITHYVLVTNSSISPCKYFKIQESAKNNNCEFVLVDQNFLHSYLKKQKMVWGDFHPLVTSQKQPVSTARDNELLNSPNEMIPHLLVRNYSNEDQSIEISMGSNQNWEFKEKDADIKYELKPNESHASKLRVVRKDQGGSDEVFLSIAITSQKTKSQETIRVDIPEVVVNKGGESAFYGDKNIYIATKLSEKINASKFGILYLFGAAGIGKSRIIDELHRNHLWKTNKIIKHELSSKNEDYAEFVKKIKDEIKKECLAPQQWAKDAYSFEDIIKECENIPNSHLKPVIILDNFHNINTSFFNEIKRLVDCKFKNVKIVIVGRDDFSAGSNEYYAFKDLCEEDKEKFAGYTVEKLSIAEAKLLLYSELPPQLELPNTTIDKICELSNNNPLYIIQYAQYFIDRYGDSNLEQKNIHEKLVSEKLPKKIEAIYDARFKHLKHILKNTYEPLMTSLCALVTIGNEVKRSIVEEFIKHDDMLDLLIERKFLLRGTYNYRFAHETLFLYLKEYILKNKDVCIEIAKIFVNDEKCLQFLDNRERGKMFCWHNDYRQAADCFKDDIETVRKFIKFSSTNVNKEIYEYIENIVEILSHIGDKDIIGNALLLKIYISLHYYNTRQAINDCDDALNKLEELEKISLLNLEIIKNDINVLKAHAYMNSAQYKKAELLYSELICKFINQKKTFRSAALFDMWDRFASLHIAYNLPDLADKYIKRSIKEKNKDNGETYDPNDIALIELTKGKLCFFSNPSRTYDCIQKIEKLKGYEEISDRIRCHIRLTKAITAAVISNWDREKLQEHINIAHDIKYDALKNTYTFSIVRAYNFLSILYYLKERKETMKSFEQTKYYANKGLDACTDYGDESRLGNFYNILALVSIKQNSNKAPKYFNAMFNTLRNQNLLTIGSNKLCCGNILALNNIAKFLADRSEKEFNEKIGQLNFKGSLVGCDPKCKEALCKSSCTLVDKSPLKTWFKDVRSNQSIITTRIPENFLDKETGYYIIIA
ncbi:MAG: ATP-binding protein [Candidatus Bathyarchaeota archaeon]|nr:ATP-binding protein [Candidatus Termiticorpusculum sp.]